MTSPHSCLLATQISQVGATYLEFLLENNSTSLSVTSPSQNIPLCETSGDACVVSKVCLQRPDQPSCTYMRWCGGVGYCTPVVSGDNREMKCTCSDEIGEPTNSSDAKSKGISSTNIIVGCTGAAIVALVVIQVVVHCGRRKTVSKKKVGSKPVLITVKESDLSQQPISPSTTSSTFDRPFPENVYDSKGEWATSALLSNISNLLKLLFFLAFLNLFFFSILGPSPFADSSQESVGVTSVSEDDSSGSIVLERGPLRWVTKDYFSNHTIVPRIQQTDSMYNMAQDMVIPAIDETEESFDILPHQLCTLEFLGSGEIGQVHKGQLTIEVRNIRHKCQVRKF